MDTSERDLIAGALEEYVGDELTLEDLQKGYSALIEDERTEHMELEAVGGAVSDALRTHWPEYVMEAAELGIFMMSAATFGVLLDYPGSPLHQAVADPVVRRILAGCAMGLTAIGIIYSPWGKQSGAHMNPSLTLAFLRLGRVKKTDALFYVSAQFVGGILGVIAARIYLGRFLGHPTVNYVATLPGPLGPGAAFAGEFVIAFLMMLMVLQVSNSASRARYTEVYVRHAGQQSVVCAKLHHQNNKRCIHCGARM